MNAGSLWAGTEYAWAEYRPRGSFPMLAQKVKLIKVTKRRVMGNDNASTFATVEVLTGHMEGKTHTIKARDIVNFWDEYVSERDHRAEAREKEQQERDLRASRMREELAARAKKEAAENQLIANALETRGIEKEAIRSLSSSSIVLDRAIVMSWLGIDAE